MTGPFGLALGAFFVFTRVATFSGLAVLIGGSTRGAKNIEVFSVTSVGCAYLSITLLVMLKAAFFGDFFLVSFVVTTFAWGGSGALVVDSLGTRVVTLMS